MGRKRGSWWREGEGVLGVSEEGCGGEGEGGGCRVMVRHGLLLQSLAELCSCQEGIRRHVYGLNVSIVEACSCSFVATKQYKVKFCFQSSFFLLPWLSLKSKL